MCSVRDESIFPTPKFKNNQPDSIVTYIFHFDSKFFFCLFFEIVENRLTRVAETLEHTVPQLRNSVFCVTVI
jgi:hypothetical protein